MEYAQLITAPARSSAPTLACAAAGGEKRPAKERGSSVIMLVGRRDEPTDAVRDYVTRLTEALAARGIACETCELRWDNRGWLAALAGLWQQSRAWAGRWVAVQYTALMWSRRGFPFLLPLVLKLLRIRGCRVVVMFHDVYAAPASRSIDRIRVFLQEQIMRRLAINSSRVIIPVEMQPVSWQRYCEFIPVGANVPSYDECRQFGHIPLRQEIPTVAVFGIPTWPPAQAREVTAIVQSVRKASAQIGELQLVVLGRGATEAESLLRRGLSDAAVTLRVMGIRNGPEISAALCSADVFLFVRGGLSTRRGSGLAALACGLPIVAYRGVETGFPLTQAGIAFVPQDDFDLLGNELARVLRDHELRLHMAERNLAVFRQWLSWDRIASRWVGVLGLDEELSK